MGNIVVTEFMSLDGVIEDPGGVEGYRHGGWAFACDRGRDGDKFKLDEILAADAQLLGRATYDVFAASWPQRTDDVGFAEKMNTMPKYVVSTTLEHAAWSNSTVITPDLHREVPALKARYDSDIVVAGSVTLVQSLMAADLVDEYRLMVFPLVLGSGKRLFPDGGDGIRRLRLVKSAPIGPDGVTIQIYQPVRPGPRDEPAAPSRP